MHMRSIFSIITRIPLKRAVALVLFLTMLLGVSSAEYFNRDGIHLGIISVATVRTNPLTPVEREFMSLTNMVYEGLICGWPRMEKDDMRH